MENTGHYESSVKRMETIHRNWKKCLAR